VWPPYPAIFGDIAEKPEDAEETRLIEAMEGAHQFPGFYPMVVIAHEGDAFRALLKATLALEQGDAPFRISERPSRMGTYISFRVEVFVASAQVALARKGVIAALDGVLFIL